MKQGRGECVQESLYEAIEAEERNFMVTREYLISGVENHRQVWREQGSGGCRGLCECNPRVPPSWILSNIGQVTRDSSHSP